MDHAANTGVGVDNPYAAQLLVYELYRKFSAGGALAGQVTGTLVG